MITSVLVAIVVLGFLVLFHEMGHFLVAKRVGVGVLKFILLMTSSSFGAIPSP